MKLRIGTGYFMGTGTIPVLHGYVPDTSPRNGYFQQVWVRCLSTFLIRFWQKSKVGISFCQKASKFSCRNVLSSTNGVLLFGNQCCSGLQHVVSFTDGQFMSSSSLTPLILFLTPSFFSLFL